MSARTALFLGASLLLAGCGAPQPSVHAKEEARAAEVKKLTGWDRVFGAPDAAIGSANQFGFRATPYAAQGKAFASKGGPVMVAGSMAKTPNRVTFAAEGPSARQIDTIRFDLEIGDAETAKDARARFSAIVRDYLFLSDINAGKLFPMLISNGSASHGNLSGTRYTIEPGKDRLTVTFTRTGATAPTNSKPQGT